MPLAQVEIDRKCTGCGKCSIFCPTGALQKITRDKETIINHQMAHCINCRLCGLVCPEKAINYAEELDIEFLANLSVREVMEVSASRCIRCGNVYHQGNSRGLCQPCANQAKLEVANEEFFD